MSSLEPPGGRLPIGESPRWIVVHALVGFGCLVVTILLALVLDDESDNWLGIALSAASLSTLVSLGLRYAALRREMTGVELSYLRFAIFLIAVFGLSGAWALSLVGGCAFYIWTIIERRRQRTT